MSVYVHVTLKFETNSTQPGFARVNGGVDQKWVRYLQPRRASPRGHSHSSIDDSARRMSIHDSQQEATENSRSYVARGSVAHDVNPGYGFQSGHYEYARQQEPPQHHRSVQVTHKPTFSFRFPWLTPQYLN